MNALARFITFGAQDADRRMAAILAARPAAVADRYLMSSVVVRGFDRFTRVLRSVMSSSETGRVAFAAHNAWGRADWPERYRTIGLVLLLAVGVHVAATMMGAQRPGWFWLIVPALTSAFALLLLMASRSTHSPK
ncbi:MAG: hypothetical protein WD690_00195 [Vicinamibacterales bacterium]